MNDIRIGFDEILEIQVPWGNIGCDYYIVTHCIINFDVIWWFGHFRRSKITRDRRTDGPTDGRTNWRTDRQTDGRTRIYKVSFHLRSLHSRQCWMALRVTGAVLQEDPWVSGPFCFSATPWQIWLRSVCLSIKRILNSIFEPEKNPSAVCNCCLTVSEYLSNWSVIVCKRESRRVWWSRSAVNVLLQLSRLAKWTVLKF